MDGMCEWDDEAGPVTQCINLMTSRPPPLCVAFFFLRLEDLKPASFQDDRDYIFVSTKKRLNLIKSRLNMVKLPYTLLILWYFSNPSI